MASKLRGLWLGLLCQTVVLPALAASNPSITGVVPSTINDAQTAIVFTNATVTAGATNWITVTVGFNATNLGTLAPLPPGVVKSGTNYIIGPDADTNVTDTLNALVFTPVANYIPVPNSSNAVFYVRAVDADGNASSVRNATVTINSLNNAPSFSVAGAVSITDKQTANPFSSVTASDVDNQGTQSQTITITLSNTNTGFLVVGASGFTSNNFTYTYTGAPNTLSAAITALTYQPIENYLPVNLYDTNVFQVVDSDGYASVTNSNVKIVVQSINDAPSLSGATTNHIPVATGRVLAPSPFQTLTLVDVDQNDDINNNNGQSLLWSVTLTGAAPLGQLTVSGVPVGTSYGGSNEPPTASTLLRSLNYLAPLQTIANTNPLTVTIIANDQHGGRATNFIYLDLSSIVLPPGLLGTQSGQTVFDNSTIAPFSKVTIQSHNGNPVTVKIQLGGGATNDLQGQFINLGSFTKNNSVSPAVYQFSGTSEAATAAIESLLFQPTPNRIDGSSTDTATFGLQLIDGTITNAPDFSTTVTIVPFNDTPAIYGVSPLVTIQDDQVITNFYNVLVTDADENGQQTNTCTILLDTWAKGSFSTNSLKVSGFTNTGSSYRCVASPAAITAAIRKLVFVPSPNRIPVGLTETTVFSIILDDNHGGHVVNSASAVRVAGVNGKPVVSVPSPQPVSLPVATNVFVFSEVSVADATFLKLAIRINNPAQGNFATNSLAFTNGVTFTNLGGGNYFATGYATNLSPALQNLVFVPTANLAFGTVIGFTIGVTNALPNNVTATHSVVLRTVRNSYIVTKLTDYDPAANVPVNLQLGTLRNAIANARSGDHITFDIRSGVATVPNYPAVIRLVAPLTLNNDLTFDGPGADRLTISGDSDGNGTPDVQLFTVNATVVVNRLAFASGYASDSGGAFEVNASGNLKLSYCAVTDCRADQWGGGVDVYGGTFNADHCLFKNNSTSDALGQGGGAVSLYTVHPCTIYDSTFATNRQNSVSGFGGGALYAETFNPGTEFYVNLVSCSFRDNFDAGDQGSSIRPEQNNTFVRVQNSIFADGHGKNFELDQTGYVVSFGGNISDDDTYSIFSIGGSPLNHHAFAPPLDQTNIPASTIFSNLADNHGPTFTSALVNGSPAKNNSVSNGPAAAFYSLLGTDQRGYFRTNAPDIGAFEDTASQRIIIEEIGFNPPAPNTNAQFVEFYVPRDSAPLDIGGFKVLVDGVPRHTFTSQLMQPGEAIVVFSAGTVISTNIYQQNATGNLLMSRDGGTITLLNSSNQPVFEADYVGAFVSTDPNDYGSLTNANQSLVLSPQFQGVFLPYQRVVNSVGGADITGISNPGYDASGKPLTSDNAPPIAFPDTAATDAHTDIADIFVLANDIDPDITDTLQIVGVGVTGGAPGVTNLIGHSAFGALLTINTNGTTINYDPTASAYLQSLPQGSNVVDSFQYTILDYYNVTNAHNRGVDIDRNTAKATATVTLNVVGVNTAPTPHNDGTNTTAILATAENAVLDFTTVTNILGNDTDTNSDDYIANVNVTNLNIVSISPTSAYLPNNLTITTALGATVTLDIRFDRNQAHITYNPTNSAILRALNWNQATNDTFYYSVQDSHGAVGTAAISITVTGVDNAPVANPDSLTTDENTPITNAAAFFLANDADVDNGHTLTITNVSPRSALGATVTLVGTNLVYDPTASTNLNALAQKEFVTDTFTYTITDDATNQNLTSTTNVTVLVAGVNDSPVSQADFYTTNEDSLLTITAANGVLANDRDPDTHDLIRVIPFTVNTATNCYTTANGGAPVTMAANGSFTLDPRGYFDWLKEGEPYNDKFSYVVMDHSLSVAGDDNFSVNLNTSNNVLPVLANDVVLSSVGGAFTVVGVSAPDHGGKVSINASNNAVIYTPAAGYVGPETFAYTNSDGLGGGDWAKVNVTVVGSLLYAVNDAFTVAKGTTNSLNLLANDVIIPATGANISIVGLIATNLSGTVTLNGTGPNNSVNYAPGISAPYTETFGYVIASGSLTATGMVTVSAIDRGNSLPSGKDIFTVLAGSANNPLNVLTNDSILPGTGSNLFLTTFDSVSNLTGTIVKNNTSTRLLYTPLAGVTNESGSLTYHFADGLGGTGSNTVNIQVVTGGFFANDDNYVLYKNSTNTLTVMVNDGILPNLGQTLYISDIGIGTNAPTHGLVTINGAGTGLIYVPTNGYSGSDDFTYEITDGSPARAQGRVHVTVLDNSAVASNPDTYRVARESINNSLPVLANDYSLPLKSGLFSLIGLIANGVHANITINGNNALLYTPNTGFIGRDVFSYIFADSNGNRGTNQVVVTVGDLAPRDDSFNAVSGSTNNVLDVRANDYSFPDTNALRKIYSLGTPDQGGAVTVNSNSTLVLYSPASSFTGIEHFSYQLADDTTNLFSANVTVTVRRAGSDRDTNTVTIAIVGVNDLPTITGAQSGFHITDKQTVQPFTNVVIGDLDECGFQTNIVTVRLDASAKGTLINLGGFVAIAPGVYRMQDSPPAITASLKTLVFVPTENRIIVPNSELTTFTIVANDGYGTPQTNNTTTVLVDSVNDAPIISGAQGGYQINDKQTVQPFTNVIITEVDDSSTQRLVVNVSLDLAAKGTLQNLGSFTNAGNGIYSMTGTAANITTSLATLRFVPTENRITVPTTEMTRLTISVNDSFTSLPVTNTDTTIFVTATNDPATIVGTLGGWNITDKQTLMPFTNVVVADVDDLTVQPLTVVVALDLAEKGVLQNLGGFTNSGNGTYTIRDVATNISASIRNLVFRPTENRIIVPNSETTALTITVNDGFQFPLVTDTNTTITVASVNDAPTVVGTATNSITDKQTVQPFTTVTFADVDNLAANPAQPQPLTVRIVMDNLDKGNLQNLGGFTVVSNGVFQLTAIAPTVTTAIRGITFVPVENHIIVPTTARINFAISADDGFVATPTTNKAAVNVTAVNDAPVITGTVAGQIVYDRGSLRPFAGVLITEVDNDKTQALRCVVSLDSASKGVLTSLGGFTDLGGGIYSYGTSNGVITAANITAALRGLVFSPTTASRVTPGFPETTRFTIRVDDFFAPTVVDTNTTVTAYDALSAKVTASDRLNGSQFGWSVATLRDVAVIGAPHDTSSNSGSAYIYVRSLDGSNTWTQLKKLVAPDGRANDAFGTAVAISEDTIVIGAPFNDEKATDAGAAYVFSRNQPSANQWGFVKKILPSDGAFNDQFGSAVTVSNTLILVGAPLADAGALADSGAVYFYERDQPSANQWGQTRKLTTTNTVAGDRFGSSISISGDTLAVGVPNTDSGSLLDVGVVYLYGRNQGGASQWGQVKRLSVTNTVAGDRFGSSVSISGDNLAIGAPLNDVGTFTDGGAAYIFNRNQTGAEQWGLVKKFTLTNAFTGDHFGASVALDADSLVISAPQADGTNGIDWGVAYLYQQNSGGNNAWGQVDKFFPAAVGAQDNFGSGVAISRGTIVIGAYNGLDSGVRYGTAYMFRIFFNNPPQLLIPLANQFVTVGTPFNFAVAAGAFADPDLGDALTYSLAASPVAPNWLSFDPNTGIFSGTPTAVGAFPVSLLATDIYGNSTASAFTVTATGTPGAAFNQLSARLQISPTRFINLQLTGNPGTTYRVQQATNLIGAVWVDVTSQIADVNGQINVNITNPPSPSFYRTVTP